MTSQSTTVSPKPLWPGLTWPAWQQAALVVSIFSLLTLIGLGVWLTRGPWTYPTQAQASQILEPTLSAGGWGQSFYANYGGLQGVAVKLSFPFGPSDEAVRLVVYHQADLATPLRTAVAEVGGLSEGDYLNFDFEPLSASAGEPYFFTLEPAQPDVDSRVNLYAAPVTAYVDGAVHQQGSPVDAQLTFWLSYQRAGMVAQWVSQSLQNLPLLAVMLVFLLLPGATVLIWLRPPLTLDPAEWLAVTIGLSLSAYPIFLVFSSLTPLRLTPLVVWLGFITLALLAGFGWRRKPPAISRVMVGQRLLAWAVNPAVWALLIVLGISAGVRWLVIQNITMPMWADSYHHSMISQLIVENGRIPSSWEPYAPLQSLNYHIGFHSMVAVFHWLTAGLSGAAVPHSVLWFGQVLNLLAVLMAYLLGRRFGGGAWAGIGAALFVGLISTYPFFYVNWGRYTQLAGQAILPVLMVMMVLFLQAKERSWVLATLTILLAAGLGLTHYRVTIFFLCFMVAFLLIRWLTEDDSLTLIREDFLRLLGVGVTILILVFPRLWLLVGSRLWDVKIATATEGMDSTYTREVHNALINMFDHYTLHWVVLAWLAWAVGSWRKNKLIFSLGAWWWVLLLATNPHYLNLPGAGLITNFAIYIGAYLILGPLIGYVFGLLIQTGGKIFPYLFWMTVPALVILTLWSARPQLQNLQVQGLLVTKPDVQAMAWLEANTPSTAKFLVNSRLAYGGWTVAGTDAGWWLPFLTDRQNTAPPLLYGTETPIDPYYNIDLYNSYVQIREPGLSPPELAQQMQARDLTHIYIGQQRGRVWQGDETPFDPAWFEAAPQFELIYAQDAVRIFALVPPEGGF